MKNLQTAFEKQKDKLQDYAAERGVEWIFIPPRAPNFGGLWEAAVKAAKHQLVRGAGIANLTHDQLNIHLVDVEALLNSRPLAVEGSNPNDGEPLTPGHLLLGQALTMQPREYAPGMPCNMAISPCLKRRGSCQSSSCGFGKAGPGTICSASSSDHNGQQRPTT